ncbi:Hpt domain-containing protein [Gemmobacter megaterium]|uniref:Hpt domain-containing protein n=1 Tax=Gemmobacter megaterium TaxID=1086013 RepID=A0A1N7M2Y2_9RHOB|nr:Hpt domain-containing protein [Gemmobacter megaterium]GGE09137.1 nickel transporter [Gemmobacter megaterium]SIS80434.1 Hpt domain-containing protein [Gemmobacter megaterium]
MINWERVTTLRDEVGADSFMEVVALFLDEVDEVVSRFRETPDPGNVERDMHFLKGSALNLGFEALGEMCQNGERMAAEGRAHEVDIPSIVIVYEESRETFLDGLDQRPA